MTASLSPETARACRLQPLTERERLTLALMVGHGSQPYRALALLFGLRDEQCVTFLAGALPSEGCPGVCLR